MATLMVFASRRVAASCSSGRLAMEGRSLVLRRRFSPLAWYNKQLTRSPMLTKSLTSGFLFSLGDVIAQLVTKEKEDGFDWKRLGRASIFGTFILGPLAHLHYGSLEWLIVKRFALTGFRMPVAKMIMDQSYWACSINAVYLFTLPALEGKSRQEAFEQVKQRWVGVMKANWTLWPAVQLINFRFVPVPHQLNFVLMVSLLWATYLSWYTGKSAKEEKARRMAAALGEGREPNDTP